VGAVTSEYRAIGKQ